MGEGQRGKERGAWSKDGSGGVRDGEQNGN